MHAYADQPYDRSSFHLAGHSTPLVAVATQIIKGAIQGLLANPQYNESIKRDSSLSRHPFVGIVDHVSVMPLENKSRETNDNDDRDSTVQFMTASEYMNSPTGSAARKIGNIMEGLGVDVHYFGDAHPNKTPLATVRRKQTSFFRSGGLNDNADSGRACSKAGVSTVGAPPMFVENFNIRLQTDKKTARSLTRALRERDGGIRGVEALTLPYGEGRYEVACNLLCPDVGSVGEIKAMVNKWAQSVEDEDAIVEKAYRVGTTVDQCLDALWLSDSIEDAIEYDELVMKRFRKDLNGSL